MTTEPPDDEHGPDDGLPPLPDHLRNRPDGPQDHSRSQGRLIILLLFGAIPLIVVFLVVLNSLGSGPPTAGQGEGGGATSNLNEITRYCIYTAKDDADYGQCLDRTRIQVVQKERSNAARYARGELDRCLPGSGYRCTLR